MRRRAIHATSKALEFAEDLVRAQPRGLQCSITHSEGLSYLLTKAGVGPLREEVLHKLLPASALAKESRCVARQSVVLQLLWRGRGQRRVDLGFATANRKEHWA